FVMVPRSQGTEEPSRLWILDSSCSLVTGVTINLGTQVPREAGTKESIASRRLARHGSQGLKGPRYPVGSTSRFRFQLGQRGNSLTLAPRYQGNSLTLAPRYQGK